MESIGSPGLWLAFGAIVLFMLAIDLFVVGGGRQHRVSFREAATWSVVWVTVSFLLVIGVKMWWFADEKTDMANNPLLKWLRGHMKITDELHGEKFFVWRDGVRFATPLLLALILVEISDLIFAVDSIPAIFAITGDPFIVLTSNVFAILGLRAMYFLLADMADRFTLLKYGLAAVLVFIGVKMILIDIYKIPIGFSLSVVATFIGISIWLSLRKNEREQAKE